MTQQSMVALQNLQRLKQIKSDLTYLGRTCSEDGFVLRLPVQVIIKRTEILWLCRIQRRTEGGLGWNGARCGDWPGLAEVTSCWVVPAPLFCKGAQRQQDPHVCIVIDASEGQHTGKCPIPPAAAPPSPLRPEDTDPGRLPRTVLLSISFPVGTFCVCVCFFFKKNNPLKCFKAIRKPHL